MQVHITGRHVDITDAVREHIYDKVQRSLGSFTRVHDVEMVLEVQKRTHMAEVVVKGKDHIHLEAEEESDNLYKSIDQAIEKVERQLRKSRDKVQAHH